MRLKHIFLLTALSINTFIAPAQKNTEKQISDSLTVIANNYAALGRINIAGIEVNQKDKIVTVLAGDVLAQIPFRKENVQQIYNMLSNVLSSRYPGFKILCVSDKRYIEDYIPNFYRQENIERQRLFKVVHPSFPLVTKLSVPYKVEQGLQDRHIALWQSHGWYYNQKSARWTWQRARLFQTVEDLYTQSYVLPFLTPMLENAGANVLLPRERDTQLNEVIIDNDNKIGGSRYHEHNDRKSWKTGGTGFAFSQKVYLQGENPFAMGTYRYIPTINDTDEMSYAEWNADIPEAGNYAVYVSYKTTDKSAPDARYTVYHRGGKTEFKVNQTIHGGTWLYLGHFKFNKGRSNQARVVLSNFSSFHDKIITADAVKIGGGMGNMARNPNVAGSLPNQKSSDSSAIAIKTTVDALPIEPVISGYPRYTEAARYWLQWAGMPDSIYSITKGMNDYNDDYQSRGHWVNFLAGGSSVLPGKPGLNVPVDMALAFHTDAGTFKNDSIVGTLAICTVTNSDGKTVFENGYSRWTSRDLTDIVQTQIVHDIRKTFAPEWTRRGLWNKSYSESRVPEVPSMLLELLSHQNLADMRYGLDPRFRFTVSRAIYKGILKYLSFNSGTEYVVQPLPIEGFSTRFVARNKVELKWIPVHDSIEPTAKPDKYIVYTRIDDGGFNNGVISEKSSIVLDVQPGKIYSFKVAAINKGGESFPSEILSVYRANNDKPEVLIVNGFDRLSAPLSVVNPTAPGFYNDEDAGVSYISDYAFIGKQYEFDRSKPWKTDDDPGFGASYSNYENKEIAGNNFDYPYLHGKAIKAAGYSFVSTSRLSVEKGTVDLKKYKVTDLILGKQKQTYIGNTKKPAEFKTFPLALQQSLRSYCLAGGHLMLSGAYIASDFYKGNYINTDERIFSENILKYKFKSAKASLNQKVKMVNSPFAQFNQAEFEFYDKPNKVSYSLESTDAIEPAGDGAVTICRYAGTHLSAGVAYSGNYKVCSFGFPFETIQSEKERNRLMESVLDFFNAKSAKLSYTKK